MGFFDDYKLKTPEETLMQSDSMKEKQESMMGTKGEETGYMDDMIYRDSDEIAKVLQAVNRVCTEKDAIDAIIADRITNQNVTDEFTRRGRYNKKLTAVNMNDFIDSVTVFNNRLTNRVYDSSSNLDNFETPLLPQNNHMLSG